MIYFRRTAAKPSENPSMPHVNQLGEASIACHLSQLISDAIWVLIAFKNYRLIKLARTGVTIRSPVVAAVEAA